VTFFLVRLLQQFTGFTLEKSENIQPPAEWAACGGLKATEKVYPTSHLTMYIKVSVFYVYIWNSGLQGNCVIDFSFEGWPLDPDGTADDFGELFGLGGTSFK
jgi:hypothetical protein